MNLLHSILFIYPLETQHFLCGLTLKIEDEILKVGALRTSFFMKPQVHRIMSEPIMFLGRVGRFVNHLGCVHIICYHLSYLALIS